MTCHVATNDTQIAFAPFASFWVWLKPRGLDSLLAVATPPPVKRWANFVTMCLSDRTKAEQEAQRRLATDPDFEVRKDFFHYLFHAQDPQTGRGFPMEELWGEAESMIIAGSDTTSIVVTAMFFYLARKPDVQVSPHSTRCSRSGGQQAQGLDKSSPLLTISLNTRPSSPRRSDQHSTASTT